MAAHLAEEHSPDGAGVKICAYCQAEGTNSEIDAHVTMVHQLTDLETSTEVELLLTSSH